MNLPPGLLRNTGSRPNQLIQGWKIGDTLLYGLDGRVWRMPSSDPPSSPETKLSEIYTHF